MKFSINLASRTYVDRRSLYACYLLLATVLLATLSINASSFWRSRTETARLRGLLFALQPENAARPGATLGNVDDLKQRIGFANELLLRDHYRWTALLDQLELVTAGGIRIVGVHPDFKKNVVSIEGLAVSVTDLRRFLDRLAASPDFAKVYLLKQQTREEGDIAFSITTQRISGT